MNTAPKHNAPKIVFMGTPEFAVESLKALLGAGFQVVGVITAPDRPAGRGRKLQYSAVKEFALEQGLEILQPTNLKDPGFLESLQALGADLQVVVAFRMLPRAVWAMPALGTFNLHASLLPQYRGAAPINWAIINGETRTGLTTFFLDDKIDTGSIILQEEEPIGPTDDAGSLHDRLKSRGAALVVRTCEMIAQDRAEPLPQRESGPLKAAPKLDRDNSRIDLGGSLQQVHDHIRGLSPYPGAWCILANGGREDTLKLFSTKMEPALHGLPLGTLVREKDTLKVALRDGFLHILHLQLPGKRRMEIKEVLNGMHLEGDAHLR